MGVSGSSNTRGGKWVGQPGGYDAFIPTPLPPDPSIAYDDRMVGLLSRADQAIGRLDGEVRNLPNPDLFVAMYVRREAVLSSQIEGTREHASKTSSPWNSNRKVRDFSKDVEEIVQYVAAMNHGLERLTELPVALGRSSAKSIVCFWPAAEAATKAPAIFGVTRTSLHLPVSSGLNTCRCPSPPPAVPVDEMRQTFLDDLERF